jgi:hypothetical protein
LWWLIGITRRIVAAAGIALTGDTEACRWVAVRHTDDHIHVVATVATLVRQDCRRPKQDYDIRAVRAKPTRSKSTTGCGG